MPDDFTARQRRHAQQFQTQLQALYTHLQAGESPAPPPLAERLTQTLAVLEEIRAALPDRVNQGKILAAVSILRSVLATL